MTHLTMTDSTSGWYTGDDSSATEPVKALRSAEHMQQRNTQTCSATDQTQTTFLKFLAEGSLGQP
jgi:hypothetical protein